MFKLDQIEHDCSSAALIGLGRRGCEYAQQLHKAQYTDSCAFLIDYDSALQGDALPDPSTYWIGHTEIEPDFSACDLMGIVIVGAEYQNEDESFNFRVFLSKERPALMLGIVLPPPAGELVRMDLTLLEELDCVMRWPGDPALPEWGALLHIAVNDWLAPVLGAGLVCIDISDVIYLFCRNSQSIVMSSASASLEQPQAAARAALASLYKQGFKPDQTTGLLVVIRGGLITMGDFEAVLAVFNTLPDTVTVAAATPLERELRDCLRVTLFSTIPSA
ncbi:MAG: hypothetical protein IPL99_08500 [Candidatus Competibacteraceae bacterium]|nr:hypothetical protein [Candidatus Competibacteraceae bacterium]